MKTAGRENQTAGNASSNRAHGAQSAQILLSEVGCEARKRPAVGDVFLLTSPFIELIGLRIIARPNKELSCVFMSLLKSQVEHPPLVPIRACSRKCSERQVDTMP